MSTEEQESIDLQASEGEASGLDLDDDLFGFDRAQEEADEGLDDVDLDEIFAAFHEPGKGGSDPSQEFPGVELTQAAAMKPGRTAPDAATPEGARASSPPAVAVLADPSATDAEELLLRKRAQAAPAASAAPQRSTTVMGFGRSVLMILASVTVLNVTIALITLKSAGEMKASIANAGRHVSEAARELRLSTRDRNTQEIDDRALPSAGDVESHPLFKTIERDLEAGNYPAARQRIYSLLSVIDRHPPETREEIEARASFLLARTLHFEALSAGDDPR